MSYWDASAIAPLCVVEPSTDEMWELLSINGTMITWWGTYLELADAVVRQAREEALSESEVQGSLEVLEQLRETWIEIGCSPRLQRNAVKNMRIHGLSMDRAIQLAAAQIPVGSVHAGAYTFVSLDPALRSAALLEGFKVEPPEPLFSRHTVATGKLD